MDHGLLTILKIDTTNCLIPLLWKTVPYFWHRLSNYAITGVECVHSRSVIGQSRSMIITVDSGY